MPPKGQLAHIKELAQWKKKEAKSGVETIMFEDESTEKSWIPENDTSQQRNQDWEKESDSEDDVEMTDDDNEMLNVNAFDILLNAARDSSNFKKHKLPYSRNPELSEQQKKRRAGDKRGLAASVDGCQLLTTGFLTFKASEISETPEISIKSDRSSLSLFFLLIVICIF